MSELLYRGSVNQRFHMGAGKRHLITVTADAWHDDAMLQLVLWTQPCVMRPCGPILHADDQFLLCIIPPSWWEFRAFGVTGARCTVEKLTVEENDAYKAQKLAIAAVAGISFLGSVATLGEGATPQFG